MDPTTPVMELLRHFANWSLSFDENGQYSELISQVPVTINIKIVAAYVRIGLNTEYPHGVLTKQANMTK